ncbi:hypothetical protein [Shouchella shacheensis]|uniref:hypothetical protein n=1 Tax=Shouchella shacheensis TaxID=1649580 RepID=UPI00073FB2AA|nr:hypothetical protein [Shouchella shacheensis]
MSYLKLVHFELSRFMKIYLSLIGLVILTQFLGVYLVARAYLEQAESAMTFEGMTPEAFVHQFGAMDFTRVLGSLWFNGGVALSVATLLLYAILIWYREWIGKNTFAYRLLTLPTHRMSIYFAKLTAVFLMTLGLVTIQIPLLVAEQALLAWLIPQELYNGAMSVQEIVTSTYGPLNVIIPADFGAFLIHYGIGSLSLLVLFTMILFERSFKWKGMVFAFLYGVGALLLVIGPFFFFGDFSRFLYDSEIFLLLLGLTLFLAALSIWVSYQLITKKITV